MIKCKEGQLYIKGSMPEIMADFSTIVYGIRKEVHKLLGEEAVKIVLKDALEMGFMSDEEIQEGLEKLKKEMEDYE